MVRLGDKNLLFCERSIEKFALCIKKKWDPIYGVLDCVSGEGVVSGLN